MLKKLLSCALLVCALPSANAAEAWWHKDWKVRRKVVVRGRTNAPGDDICYAEFYTGGMMQKDGRDVRVVESGRLVPYQIIHFGPGDFVKLVIKLDKTRRSQRTYYVYYGNPKAKPLQYKFEIQRGLLLEVRQYKGGGCGNWRQMQATMRKAAGYVMNRGFVKQIHYGYNPFGPSTNCFSIYTGWLAITKPGPYTFAVTSDDASFFFVDGKMTIQYPGIHRAVRDARRNKTVTLKRGLHKIELYHLQLGAYMAAVVAWRPPWEKNKRRFRIVPKEAFAQPIIGSVGHYETADKSPSPDFTATKAGEAYIDGKPIVRIQFHNRSYPIVMRKPTWDFGDGQKGVGSPIDHVYFAPGLYKVAMRINIGGKTRTIAQVVDAFQDWDKQISRKLDKLSSYHPIVSQYDFAKMDANSLAMAGRYFEYASKWADAAKALGLMLKKAGDLDDTTLYERTVAYANVLSKHLRRHQAAIAALAKAEAKVRAAPYKARLAIAAGRVALDGWRNPEAAMPHFTRVLTKYGKAGSDMRRRALIGLGDAYRQQAEHDKALEKYRQAMMIPVSGQRYQKAAAVRVGAFSRAIEYYLRTRRPRDLRSAEEYLNTWEWEYPADKLIGYSSVLRARLYRATKRLDEAIDELEEFVAVSPHSHYVGQAMIELAKCYYAKRDKPKARNVL